MARSFVKRPRTILSWKGYLGDCLDKIEVNKPEKEWIAEHIKLRTEDNKSTPQNKEIYLEESFFDIVL